MNAFTLDRATEYARSMIEAVGLGVSDVRIVQINGAVGPHKRDLFWGHAVRYRSETNGECIAFWPADDFRDVCRAYYIVDGVGMYVAGWQGAGNGSVDRAPDGDVKLHPITVHNADMLPRRAYVLHTAKVRSFTYTPGPGSIAGRLKGEPVWTPENGWV